MRDDRPVQITVLGTGTSTGVPVIGCSCRVCTSTDPRDQRLRCSCFVQVSGVDILIDVGPDFRTQAMRAGIENVDAVLITHHHFDHVVGLDDLRPFLFENRTEIPCYASPESAEVLGHMFAYIFQDGSYPGTPKLSLNPVDGAFRARSRWDESSDVDILPIPANHGELRVFGFRIGNFAYLTDTSSVPASSLPLLEGLDVLILDALRHTPHTKHMTIDEAVSTAQQIDAEQTYFIHMAHSILHEEEDEQLPAGISLAYDGLALSAGL